MHKKRRWAAVALLAAGIAIGIVMVATPAGAHVSSWAHNWNAHIKPKVNKLVGRAAVEQQAGAAVDATGVGSFGTIVDVNVRAPKNGFVLVTGTARLDGGTTCPCEAGMRLFDGTNASFIYRIHKDATGDSEAGTISFVFSASKGLHTYSVQLDERAGDLAGASSDGTITALFVPYNGTGGTGPARIIARAQAGA